MELSCAATLSSIPPPQIVTAQTMTAPAKPIQVLLVEDDAEAADLVEVYLTDEGTIAFYVEWVPTLVRAMGRLGAPGVDVVLLDLGLPELNGYKTYRAIEASAGGNLPIVILTSDDRSVSRDLTLGFGAADYLLKSRSSPFQLREALRSAVERFRRRRVEGTKSSC